MEEVEVKPEVKKRATSTFKLPAIHSSRNEPKKTISPREIEYSEDDDEHEMKIDAEDHLGPQPINSGHGKLKI